MHNHLQNHIEETQNGIFINHPFCFCKADTPEDFPLINSIIEQRVKCENLSIAQGNHKPRLMIRVPRERIKLLSELLLKDEISLDDALLVARQTWLQQKSVFALKQEWKTLFNLIVLRGVCPSSFMSASELVRYKALPDELTIYRASLSGHKTTGLSWTLSRKVAKSYADKYRNSRISRGVISKRHVMGVLLARNEYEIVVDDDIHVQRMRRVFSTSKRCYA